jgi:hypothetical protein
MEAETKSRYSVLSSTHTLRVQVGEVCCLLSCRDEETIVRLKQLYGDFLSDQKADITLELKTIDKMSIAEFEETLPRMKISHDASSEGDLFGTTDLVARGECDLNAGTVAMNVEKHFLNSNAGRGFVNHGLCLVYYTACKLKHNGRPPALIVHSCGILRHGQVLLFAGPSGIGKTTVARLCGDKYGRVLNDEGVLVSRPNQHSDALMVQGIPIIGELPHRLNIIAPLKVVLLLKQSQRTSVRRLSQMEAYTRFMRQVARPVYLGQQDRRTIYSLIAEFSDEVSRTTPFYELEFTLDREPLWQAIEELELSLDKERRYDEEPDNHVCRYHLAPNRG